MGRIAASPPSRWISALDRPGLKEERVAAAEELLCSEKVAVGIPANERLHCRVMFSNHGRRGTPWEQLGPKGVYALVERVCERVRHLEHGDGARNDIWCHAVVCERLNHRALIPIRHRSRRSERLRERTQLPC